jgi:hypothetical protein
VGEAPAADTRNGNQVKIVREFSFDFRFGGGRPAGRRLPVGEIQLAYNVLYCRWGRFNLACRVLDCRWEKLHTVFCIVGERNSIGIHVLYCRWEKFNCHTVFCIAGGGKAPAAHTQNGNRVIIICIFIQFPFGGGRPAGRPAIARGRNSIGI